MTAADERYYPADVKPSTDLFLRRCGAPALAAICAAMLAPWCCAQADQVPDWRMPFRKPLVNLQPPEAMWEHLEPMLRIAAEAPAELRRFDEHGVEVVDDPRWRKHLEALRSMPFDAPYLSLVIRESKFEKDRQIAFYGAFLSPDPQQVFALIEHIPGEPSRAIRQDAYLRAASFLRAHPTRRPAADAGPGEDGLVAAMRVDPAPFVALLEVDDERDRLQALWFLARLGELRPEAGIEAIGLGHDALRAAAGAESQRERVALRDFVAILDPVDAREAPAKDAVADDVVAWFDVVHHDLYPPIRRRSSGLVDLHPSPELDEIVAAGARALRDGSIGTDAATGSTKDGIAFRGFRLDVLPAPLDLLGLEHGWVITAINGLPTPSAESLLAALRRALPQARRFFVEYVDRQGEVGAVEFRRL